MKKTILLALLTLFCCHTDAQNTEVQFDVNETGCFQTSDGKDFVVIQVENKKAKEIYDDVLCRIAKVFVSPEGASEKVVDGRLIVINGREDLIAKSNGPCWYDLFYKIIFEFKDGKMKVSAPEITQGRVRYGSINLRDARTFKGTYAIEELVKENPSAKPDVENFFNTIINNIIKQNTENDNW